MKGSGANGGEDKQGKYDQCYDYSQLAAYRSASLPDVTHKTPLTGCAV
jgi:hypothetical protein